MGLLGVGSVKMVSKGNEEQGLRNRKNDNGEALEKNTSWNRSRLKRGN